MENARKIASNTIAQIASRLINAVLSIVIIKIITNYLRASGYGQYTLVYELVGFFGLACDLGLFTLAVDEMSKRKDQMQRVLGNMLGVRLLLILIIGTITTILAFVMPNFNTTMAIAVVIATVGMAANLISSTLSATLQVHLKMPTYARAVVLGKIISVIYIAAASYFNWGFQHLIIAGTLNNFYVCLVTILEANKLLPIRIYFERSEVMRVLRKSAIYGTSIILSTVYLRINSLMLGQVTSGLFGQTTSDGIVGVFGVAMRSYELLLLIPFSFMNSVLPSLAEHVSTPKFKHLLQKSWDVLVMTGVGIGVGSYIMAEEMIQLISTGTDFAPAAGLMRILVIASSFNFLGSMFEYILVSLNQTKKIWWVTLAEAVAAIGFAWWMIPSQGAFSGAYATAWAIVIAQVISCIGLMFFARSQKAVKLQYRTTIATMISGAISGLFLVLLRPYILQLTPYISVPLSFGTGGLLYIFLLLRTGALPKELGTVVFEKLGFKKTESQSHHS